MDYANLESGDVAVFLDESQKILSEYLVETEIAMND